ATEPAIQLWQKWFRDNLPHELQDLQTVLHSQKDFAQAAKHILKKLKLDTEQKPNPELENEESEEQETAASQGSSQEKTEQQQSQETEQQHTQSEQQQSQQTEQIKTELTDTIEDPSEQASQQPRRLGDNHGPLSNYKIYTRKFDEIARAEDLCDMEELTRLRAMLDQQMTLLQSVIAKLTNR